MYGAKAGVSVDIRGVDKSLAAELGKSVTLVRQKDSPRLTGALVRTLFDRASGEFQEALKALGYYKAVVKAQLNGTAPDWKAEFDIDKGPATRITELSVKITGPGSSRRRLIQAAAAFPLKKGDCLDQGEYELGKRMIHNAARDLGFLDGAWQTHTIEIDPAHDSARIVLVFASGERYRYGDIELPDTVISRTVLERMQSFHSGDPFDAAQIIAFQQKLRDSNYFKEVEVTPRLDNLKDHRIPVKVNLVPNTPNAIRVGAGYGTDTGPRVSATWDRRYLNPAGHRLEADLKLAPVTSSLTGSYLIPYFRGRDVELGITSTLAREDTNTSTSNSIETGIKRLTQRWGWNESIGLSYRFEDFTVGGVHGTSNLLMPAIGYWRSRSDDPVYPRNGYRLGIDLRSAVRGIISDVTFAQVELDAKYIHALGEGGRLVTRAHLGATAVSNVQHLPASLRFFAGGDNSVRGFDYQSLGPRDSQGKVIGGRYLAVGSIGYEHQIYGNWGAAVFSDFGNAFDKFNNNFAYSVGVGLRWRSPVGLVRVDVATGLSDPSHPIRLHVVVGPEL